MFWALLFFHQAPYPKEMFLSLQGRALHVSLHAHVSSPWRARLFREMVDTNGDKLLQEEEKEKLARLVLRNFFSSLTLYLPRKVTFTEPLDSDCEGVYESATEEYPFACSYSFSFPRPSFGFVRLVSEVPMEMPVAVGNYTFLFRRARNFFVR